MNKKEIHIKNMVCARCVKVVSELLTEMDLNPEKVELGRALINSNNYDPLQLRTKLEKEGFELIDDSSQKIINAIKTEVIKFVYSDDEDLKHRNLSVILEQQIGKSYSGLSSLFSKFEGRTIEKYMIQQRIERIKELLIYDEKTVSEIAFKLGYSSGQYLSNQFKTETGLSPTEFKKLNSKSRTSIDSI